MNINARIDEEIAKLQAQLDKLRSDLTVQTPIINKRIALLKQAKKFVTDEVESVLEQLGIHV